MKPACAERNPDASVWIWLCRSWLDSFATSPPGSLLLVHHTDAHLLAASSLNTPSSLLSHALFTCCSCVKKALPWLLFGELPLLQSTRLKCHLLTGKILCKGSLFYALAFHPVSFPLYLTQFVFLWVLLTNLLTVTF